MSAILDVPCEIIFVYDDPNDTSGPAVEKVRHAFPLVRGVLNTRGPGVRNAVVAGVESSSGRYILIYAADDITPILAIGSMLRMMDQGCDFISATRYGSGGCRYGGSKLGHVLSYTANFLFYHLSASAFSDCTTGVKMFRREVFPRLQLSGQGAGWDFAFEMAVQAQLLPLKLGEVGVVSVDRLYGGQSTFRPLPWILAYTRCFLRGLRKLPPWRQPRPRLAVPAQRYI